MKFKIFKARETEEPTVLFRLVEMSDGEISLVAVNPDGREVMCGYILSITPDGKLRRWEGVSSILGLKLSDLGQIEEVR